MTLIDIETLEYEPFMLENGETVDYISSTELWKAPKIDPVNHAEWTFETLTFGHNPSTIYIQHNCSHCGRRGRTERFDVIDWEAYHKNRYKPVRPNFCPDCGYKMDLRDLYEQYKRDWCDARGYKLEDVDEEGGINGERYVSFHEWCSNEYRESRGE